MSELQVDAAFGGIYDIIGDIIRGCGAEDSSGLRRCIAGKLGRDPLIKAAPDLLAGLRLMLAWHDALRHEGMIGDHVPSPHGIDDAREALAKATPVEAEAK